MDKNAIYTVESIRYTGSENEEMEVPFSNEDAALAFARVQLFTYHARVWINNVEYTRKDFT